MSIRDRDIALLAGQIREPASNYATCMQRPSAAGVEFRSAFIRHYPEFRERVSSFEQPGVATIVVDRVNRRVAGVALLAARIGEPNAMVVGRHSHTDLLITGDQTVSLRHLAIVVEPLTDLNDIAYRVIDLRSRQGLRTEEGKVLGGIRADGPAFLAVGNYAFFFFITGDPTDWPASAADAWSFIPERVYLEERPRIARGSAPRRAVNIDRPITLVQGTRSPSRVGRRLLDDGERPIGEVVLCANGEARRVVVGPSALSDGILVGRSDRCDTAAVLRDQNLSRVHMLLVRLGVDVYAIDTASTNGSFIRGGDGERAFAISLNELPGRADIDLAGVADLTWLPY